jgi:hypothetical protein
LSHSCTVDSLFKRILFLEYEWIFGSHYERLKFIDNLIEHLQYPTCLLAMKWMDFLVVIPVSKRMKRKG